MEMARKTRLGNQAAMKGDITFFTENVVLTVENNI
jgi:hypothetical protein